MKKKFNEFTIEELRQICALYYKNDGRCDSQCPFYRLRTSKGKQYQKFCYPILKNLELLTDEEGEEEFEV